MEPRTTTWSGTMNGRISVPNDCADRRATIRVLVADRLGVNFTFAEILPFYPPPSETPAASEVLVKARREWLVAQ